MTRLAAVCVCLTLAPRVAAAEKAKVAVLPLTPQRVAKATVEILDGILVAELDQKGRYEVLGANDINAMIGFERMRDAAGCTDVVCAVEIGGALGVRYLVSGTVGTLGDELLVQLTLIDVQNAKVVTRGRSAVAKDERLYRHAVQLAVAELLGLEAPAGPTVTSGPQVASGPTFQFTTAVGDVDFSVIVTTIDGKAHQCAPQVNALTPCLLPQLAPGKASLSITSPPLTAWTDTVTVDEGEKTHPIRIETFPGVGQVMMWTWGGIGMATGLALTGVGLGVDKREMTIAGIPTFLVSAGLLVWGFFLHGQIIPDYPGIDFLF